MGAFLGISLWVALATVVPGLVTIAVVYRAFAVAGPTIVYPVNNMVMNISDWVVAGVAVTVMVLTQAIGILLEEAFVRLRLFPWCKELEIPKEFASKDKTTINAYEQYESMYILLAQLTEHEDSQGHLKRAAAQFFLTNNTLVSFCVGIIVSLGLGTCAGQRANYLYIYTGGLFLCLFISYLVAAIRFQVMAKSIWATHVMREKRLREDSEDKRKFPADG